MDDFEVKQRADMHNLIERPENGLVATKLERSKKNTHTPSTFAPNAKIKS